MGLGKVQPTVKKGMQWEGAGRGLRSNCKSQQESNNNKKQTQRDEGTACRVGEEAMCQALEVEQR